MPLYDYKCEACGDYFVDTNSISERKTAACICGGTGRQVILSAPAPMIEQMANAGCPGAFHTSGDRMEKRHLAAGQAHHKPTSKYWRDK